MNVKELQVEIDVLQFRLNELVRTYKDQLTNESVIDISEQLDSLIVEYLKMTQPRQSDFF